MKLYSLLKNINCRVLGNTILEITGLYHKDTDVKEGGLFICLRGTKVDGINFVESAIKNGAVAIVCEQEIQNLTKVTQIIVKNARETMSLLACRFFGCPAEKLKLIGVTGTNGKTTITNMLASALEKDGKKVAIIGTNGVFIKGKKYETNMTTPDPIMLEYYLSLAVKNQVEYVCMEVSAHAISLHKIDGMKFQVVIWTNLTQDHLDYFKTINRYFEAKRALFSSKYAKFAVINIDDDYGKKITESINIPFITYSKTRNADYQATNIETIGHCQKFLINNQKEVTIPILGKFNVSNALATISALNLLGINSENIFLGLKNMKQVEGRFNTYDVQGKTVVIDYAHSPDGLSNILMSAREILPNQSKLIVVFGCGGNRDKEKRPIMGKIASSLADIVVISTDNPRFEKAEDIAHEIEKGICGCDYFIELDRSKAIKKAIEMADKGDIIVLAGKGAENYIEEAGQKIPYSDYEEVEKIRRNL